MEQKESSSSNDNMDTKNMNQKEEANVTSFEAKGESQPGDEEKTIEEGSLLQAGTSASQQSNENVSGASTMSGTLTPVFVSPASSESQISNAINIPNHGNNTRISIKKLIIKQKKNNQARVSKPKLLKIQKMRVVVSPNDKQQTSVAVPQQRPSLQQHAGIVAIPQRSGFPLLPPSLPTSQLRNLPMLPLSSQRMRQTIPFPPLSCPSLSLRPSPLPPSLLEVIPPTITLLQSLPVPKLPSSFLKLFPPKPDMKLHIFNNKVIIVWKLEDMDLSKYEQILGYEIFLAVESMDSFDYKGWKKICFVKNGPLPLIHTFCPLIMGKKYHFTMRTVDVIPRFGPTCEPQVINLI